MANLEPLMQRNFLEYASYVIMDRAIPDVRDGCKPVQRRILHTLHEMDDGKFHKVANVIGETMKLHPHGDASIGDALVVLANKDYFIEKQGNFGNPLTGHRAAAARYIECRLTPLARETLFARHLTTFIPSYDGRKREPVFLPARLPVVLLLGTEGIAVGMSTRILPHNLPELWKAQIRILRGRRFQVHPDFPSGGLADVSDFDDGRGRVKIRARIERKNDRCVVIREVPHGTTTESLVASLEAAAQKGQVKIGAIHDYTTERVEIEVHLTRGVTAEEVIPQLYAYTDCEVSASSNMVVIRDNRPVEMTVSEVLEDATRRIQDVLRRDLEHELGQLQDRHHWLTLEQIFVENRVYKVIESARTDRQVRSEVVKGMEAFRLLFVRAMTDEDVDRLLAIKIRRISLYDIEKNRKETDGVVRAIGKVQTRLADIKATTIDYLKELIKKYGDRYPRPHGDHHLRCGGQEGRGQSHSQGELRPGHRFFRNRGQGQGTRDDGQRVRPDPDRHHGRHLPHPVAADQGAAARPGGPSGTLRREERRHLHRGLPDAREDPLRQEDSHPEVHPRPRLQADQGPGRQAGLPHR